MSGLLVSICIITYNQKAFIQQCISGALAQVTSFDFEIVICDDNSNDETSEICERNFKQNINKITYSKNERNLGMISNWLIALNKCQGKYIALCEGDDYWTDSNKLQEQIDFLEGNPDYSICFHRVYNKYDGQENLVLSHLNTSKKEETYSIHDLARENFIHTPSVVFRNGLIKEFPAWFNESPVGDYVLHLLNAKKGLIKYFPEPMAVYRIHNNGIWSTKNVGETHPKWIALLDKLTSENFEPETIKNLLKQRDERLNEYILWLLSEKRYELINEIISVNYDNHESHDIRLLTNTFIQHISNLEHLIGGLKKSKSYLLANKISKFKKLLK